MLTTFYNRVSLVLHPVFLPIIAAAIYLYVLPTPLITVQKYVVLGVVAGSTFLVPLLTLYLLKRIGYVKSNEAKSIEERKIPVLIMMVNFLFLGKALQEIWQVKELTVLGYATALALLITRLGFYVQTKISLHMIGMAGLLGFTLVYGVNYSYPSITIGVLIFLTGLLATARLQLKAHTAIEVGIGTLLGVGLPILINVFL